MKKVICILLMSWLPFFMAAAHAMNMQMTLENAQVNTAQTPEPTQMSCHEHMNHDSMKHGSMSYDKTGDASTSSSKTHHCSFCGFCVAGSALAAMVVSKTSHLEPANIQPLSFDVAFSSQDYPPAIKPPILN